MGSALINGCYDADAIRQGQLRKNVCPGSWISMKFGGTAVGKLPGKIAEDIVIPSLKSSKVAVVCSARSSGRKVEGTTSRLLEIFDVLEAVQAVKDKESLNYESLVKEYEHLVQVICDDHIHAAESNLKDPLLRASLGVQIRSECKEILDYRVAAERWHLQIDWRSKDRIVSFGEKLSCRFMTTLLRDRGVDAEFVDLDDVIHFKVLNGADTQFYAKLAAAIKEKVMACEGRVPVITGYFGTLPGGLIDGDIGRGYTDLCAALVAVGLKANELQVWKEIDGIFTADPTKVANAKLLPSITPAEAAELTFYGSEVIHHLTMDQVILATPPIQIRIKNVRNPRGNGTVIIPDPVLASNQLLVKNRNSPNQAKSPKKPTAITIKDNISIINVHSNKRSISYGFFVKIFSILAKRQISVDLISTSEVHVSMAIHSVNLSGLDMELARDELSECGEVSVLNNMAILSLVGAEMKNMIGIAGRMFTTLGDHNVNVELISQGASEINISCVVEAFDANRAMNVLHTHLFTHAL